MEVKAELVINELLEQIKQLNYEIALLKAKVATDGVHKENMEKR